MNENQTSAIGDGTKDLLVFQLGPVQEFIAQARSTRDLWSGSYLLSWLVAKAIIKLIREGVTTEKDVILPSVANSPLILALLNGPDGIDAEKALTPNLPNKCLFLVPSGLGAKCAATARETVLTELAQMGDSVFMWLQSKGLPDAEKLRFYAQLRAFPQITYAWTLWGEKEDWSIAYERVEKQLAARRNVRNFAQWYGVADLPKDSLSGKEEVIGDETFWHGLRRQDEDLSDEERGKLLFSAPGHAYGAINLVKRLWMHAAGDEDDHRPSYLADALSMGTGRVWDELRIPSIPEIAMRNREADNPEKPVTDSKNGYVAVLAFDGDRMGKKVSECNRAPAGLQAFSGTLSRFALDFAGKTVRKYDGHLIYAGGDDVLAILPSTTAIACGKKLQEEFKVVLGKDATASCGIAVGHKNAPLQMLVTEARKMEHAAKETYGRNAVAIALYKRSGEIIEWGANWGSKGLDLMSNITKLVGEKKLSGRFPYALAELLAPYDLGNKKLTIDPDRMMAIIRKEVAHVLSRQGEKLGEAGQKNLLVEICGEEPGEDTEAAIGGYLGECNGRLGSFIDLFLVETFLNRARNEE